MEKGEKNELRFYTMKIYTYTYRYPARINARVCRGNNCRATSELTPLRIAREERKKKRGQGRGRIRRLPQRCLFLSFLSPLLAGIRVCKRIAVNPDRMGLDVNPREFGGNASFFR